MKTAELSLAQAILDGVDEVVSTAERTWGVGRLRLLVGDDLRARWDRQWLAWCRACEAYDLAAIRTQGSAVRRAIAVLEAEAVAAGHRPLRPDVWEVAHDGRAIAVCRTSPEAGVVARERRDLEVWTVEELVRVALSGRTSLSAVKQHFPGARVTAMRSPAPDFDWTRGDELPADLQGAG
jgi:hypothetical protein